MAPATKPHVVIVGAGFGGLACAKRLGGAPIQVTIIDRRNYHLFVPLLYQVATAALSPADIAQPIRRMVSRYRNINVVLGDVRGVDVAAREVLLADRSIGFDRLVIATGSTYSYFGHDDWAVAAPGPKNLEDARSIRARLLLSFEKAEISTDPAEQAVLLTTIIVGGGPTGVEMAGAVAELTRHSLRRDFRRIDPTRARIILVEAGPRLLPAFAPALSDYAKRALERLGVTVVTGQAVTDIKPGEVTIGGQVEKAGSIIWGAGVRASPVAAWLGVAADRSGRVSVTPDMAVHGLEGIYVIGDSAAVLEADGQPLPALAQVAHQEGLYLGRALRRNLIDGSPMPPFQFHSRGNTAVIGRNAAVFEIGRWRIKGWIGWVMWALVHIYLLTGFEKRFLVASQWLWQYLTYQSGARLIADDAPANDDDH